jgi:hypothetical protein
VAFSVQSLVYLPSLSSQLLLRNMPNFSRYSSSTPMCLSSRNSSNYKGLCRIMPCVAQVCKGMIYSKTGVPWHTNKILIFLIFPVFSGFLSLFTFLHFSLILAYLCIFLSSILVKTLVNFKSVPKANLPLGIDR